MTMKFTQLITYWEPDEALEIIVLIDQLRDLLWATYGEDNIRMQQEGQHDHAASEAQLDLDFNDQIPF